MSNSYNSVLITLKELVEGTKDIEQDVKFNIPIYQRLYVWKEDQIKRLLEDTYTAFTNDANNDYYLGGVIVVKNQDRYDLIDGQQRFTTLWLIARCLKEDLKPFLKDRMHFSIRDYANDFFQSVDSEIENEELANIKDAMNTIENFFKEKDIDNPDNDKKSFSKYLYERLKLVFTTVPQNVDLNKLFETINSGGVQLQHHELLKAKMLEEITDNKERNIYSKMWDSCAFMDNYIENNLAVALNCTKTDIFQNLYNLENKKIENFIDIDKVKGFIVGRIEEVDTDKKLLIDILNVSKSQINEKIKDQEDEINVRSIISFSMLLLHTLRIFFKKNKQEDLKSIDEKELIKMFTYVNQAKDVTNKYGEFGFNEDNVKKFIELLWKVRVAFDRYIIKWVNIEENQDEVHLICKVRENTSNNSPSLQRENTEDGKAFSLLQSMLYHTQEVKTHYWLTPLLYKLVNNEDDLTIYLQQMDNYLFFPKKSGDLRSLTWEILGKNIEQKEGSFYCDKITGQLDLNSGNDYRQFSHYLFYKVEYILWCLSEEKNNDFYMRAKNSVEHISPQQPNGNYKEDNLVREELLHSFGNLSLISRERNSEFGNNPFELKRIDFHTKKNDVSNNLKMALIYANEKWGDEACNKHLDDIKEKVRLYMKCEKNKYAK